MGNFVTARTEMDNVVDKKNQCINRAGGIVTEVLLDKIKSNDSNLKAVGNDIKNLIVDFSDDDKIEILINALVNMTKNLSGKSTSKPNKKNDSNSFLSGYMNRR